MPAATQGRSSNRSLLHRMSQFVLLTLLLQVGLFAAACSSSGGGVNHEAKDEAVWNQSDAGRRSSAPKRIVSLSPSVTEILYGVGAWDQVIGVSKYCTYPEDVRNKPRIDGWRDTNLEQVMSLQPDLIIGVDAQAPITEDKLKALGVPAVFVKSQSLADVLQAIAFIGRAAGHEREGLELATETRNEIDKVRVKVQGRARPRVLCVVGRVAGTLNDLYAASHGSFLNDMIDVAGGESIAPPFAQGFGKINKEAVLRLNPEVIIDTVQSAEGGFGENTLEVWRELREVSAVEQNRIYAVRDDKLIHPSQFVGRTARIFAEQIHPQAFTEDEDQQAKTK